MKLISLCCALIMTVSACSHFSKNSNRAPASASPYADAHYFEFQKLMAEAMTFRAEVLRFVQAKKIEQDKPTKMTRQEGEWVRETARKYLKLREKLYVIALEQSKFFAGTAQIKLTPGKGTAQVRLPDPNNFPAQIETYNIDPTEGKGQETIFRIQMALSTSLLLMDNYLVAIKTFQDNKEFRYLLNYDTNDENHRALQSVTDSYNSAEYRNMMSKGIKFIEEVMEWRRKNQVPTSDEESQLYGLSQSTLWYLTIREDKTGMGNFKDAVGNLLDRISLRGTRGKRVATFGVSKGFGNMVGLVASRRGYLESLPEDEKKQIASELKPLDILLEKTPFRLTDTMIPGYYGHVAIWVGTEDELKRLGIWDDIGKQPQGKQIQEQIRKGHHIIEALRPGVQINTLEHFLNIDDLLVLRDTRNKDEAYQRQTLLQAFSQIGKEYDFNFDTNSHTRIVCSEIAHVVFSEIDWPQAQMLNRNTISPDNVANVKIDGKSVFEPVLLYFGGKRYTKDLQHSLSILLKDTEESLVEFEQFHRN